MIPGVPIAKLKCPYGHTARCASTVAGDKTHVICGECYRIFTILRTIHRIGGMDMIVNRYITTQVYEEPMLDSRGNLWHGDKLEFQYVTDLDRA